jgi:peptidyl-prolyl cis-trans isomerase B (cyclophilin B)
MSSARDNRQRAAARARLEREMAARLEAAAKRRRMIRSILGASVASLVLIGAVIWIVVAVSGNKPAPVAAQNTGCEFKPAPTNPADTSTAAATTTKPATTAATASASGSASPSPTLGPLPDSNPPRTGFRLMTITTDLGDITIQMDLSKTPCTAESMAYLAQKAFYSTGTNPQTGSCHRLEADIFILQCGDPTGSGSGGPGYTVPDENLQTNKLPAYHTGDVAMANSGSADTNGSQFFFIYQTSSLPGDYTLWGHVIKGLDIVTTVAQDGDDEAFSTDNGGPGGGHPNRILTFLKVTVGPVYYTSAIPTATPTPTTTGSATTSASASPKAS